MTDITVFTNSEFGSVRTMAVNNEVYFVGKDVAEILEYTNTPKAIRDHVDDEDKLTERIVLSGQNREVTCINESGLYSLILSSKMPKAREFKHWVTSEVLPSIRKHGMYAIDEILANPDMAIAALKELKAEREKSALQAQQIAELQPKASYYDVVLNCPDLLSISSIAKDYGKSAKWMNNYLHEKGIQFKQDDIWLLYQKHAEQGYTKTKTHAYPTGNGDIHSKIHTYWTQKGRLFIYQLMTSDGNYPLMELNETIFTH